MALLRQNGQIVVRFHEAAILSGQAVEAPTDFCNLVEPLETAIQRHIESAMILCNGNRALAAKRLGFTRQTLYRYLAKYGIVGVIKHRA